MYAPLALGLPIDVQPNPSVQVRAAKPEASGDVSAYPNLRILWRRTRTAAGRVSSTTEEAPLASTDLDLLERVARRDPDALADLYDRHSRTAFGVAYRILEDCSLAEDVVQDAFLALWRQAGSYRPERGAVRTWLVAITRNAAIDRRRGRQGRAILDRPLDDVAGHVVAPDDPHSETMSALLGQEVHAALAKLPFEQRQVIELAFFGGLTHHEIADRLDLPLGTIKGRIRLALRKLQTLLSPLAPVTR